MNETDATAHQPPARPIEDLGFPADQAEAPQAESAAPAEPTLEPVQQAVVSEMAPQPVEHEAPVPAAATNDEPAASAHDEPAATAPDEPAAPAVEDTPPSEPLAQAPEAQPPAPPASQEHRATEPAPNLPTEPSVAAPKPPPPPKSPEELARIEERKRRVQQSWERVVNARASGEVVNGMVTAAVKGGLLVDVAGIRGFLPASQVRPPQGTTIETMVRTKLPLKVIDIDQNRRRIVVSHRRAMEEERRAKRSELLSSLAVGQVREGTVVRLADFGAFVDLGGVDGLIPMRELAFERVEKAGDVVNIGEKLNVEVLRIDENGKKISLSRKNALPDPWRDHAAVLRQGSTVQGKVVGKDGRLTVEIAPGIVGTVRESDANPADYEIGEPIEVLVRRVDRTTRRITLATMHGAVAAPAPTSSGFAPLGVELGRRSNE